MTITATGGLTYDSSTTGGGGSASIGGTLVGGTTGSILFVGSGPVLSQDNNNFYISDTSSGAANSRMAASFNTNGDFTGTDALNVYGQVDAYLPNSAITTIDVDQGTPGFSASSSRGTGAIPTSLQAADMVGNFAGWGYASVRSGYYSFGAISVVAAGVTANDVGGQLDFYTKLDGGIITKQMSLTNAGSLQILANGAASISPLTITGTPFAGTATTSTPLLYINNAVTQPTTWSTARNYFGINAPAGFTGRIFDYHINGGGSVFNIGGANGDLFMTGDVSFSGGTQITYSASTILRNISNGVYRISNNAVSGFTRLVLGNNTAGGGVGIDTTATTAISFTLGDGTGNAAVTTGALSIVGKIANYNSVATAGWGAPSIYGSGRSITQSAAVASVAAYTVGAADGSFDVNANVLVTASATNSFTVTVSYTDEGNTSRTLTLTFSQLAGTLLTAITNVTGVGPYSGLSQRIRCKAATSITIATTGTFTSVTYNVEATIAQVS